MTEFNEVKDSGERRDFGTGSVRDVRTGKGRFDLIPPIFLRRLAKHVENGAVKYGDRNWELGQPLSSYLDSGMRHTVNLMALDVDEDHAAAVAWNAMAFMCTAEWIKSGMLPSELDDIGYVDALEEAEEDAELGGTPWVPKTYTEEVWQNASADDLVAVSGPSESRRQKTHVGEDPFYVPPSPVLIGTLSDAPVFEYDDFPTSPYDGRLFVTSPTGMIEIQVGKVSQRTIDLMFGAYPKPETTDDLENIQAAARRAVQGAAARRVDAVTPCSDDECSLCNPRPRD